MLHSELIPAAEKNSPRLMIMLHGLGDSLEGYRWLPDALDFPWLNYLLVNAPDSYYGGFSWFDFAGDIKPGVVRSRQLLLRLLEEQPSKGFTPEKTVLGGFSQGCLMSVEVGLRYPHRLAGIVGISGFICEPEKLLAEMPPAARQQRLLITHGTFDPMLPLPKVREQIRTLQSGGLNIEWHELVKEHTIAGEAELRLIRDFIRAGFEAGKTASPDVVSR